MPQRDPAATWTEDGCLHIELRGMAPPAPLVTTLRHLEAAAAGQALVIHLDRDPVMLYPELAARGWTAQRLDAPPGEVRLRLARDS